MKLLNNLILHNFQWVRMNFARAIGPEKNRFHRSSIMITLYVGTLAVVQVLLIELVHQLRCVTYFVFGS
jgi:hypothetical protein